MEQSSPSNLAAQRIILAQGALLATVKNSLIWCQVRVDVGLKRHDLGPVSYTHLTLPTNREV